MVARSFNYPKGLPSTLQAPHKDTYTYTSLFRSLSFPKATQGEVHLYLDPLNILMVASPYMIFLIEHIIVSLVELIMCNALFTFYL